MTLPYTAPQASSSNVHKILIILLGVVLWFLKLLAVHSVVFCGKVALCRAESSEEKSILTLSCWLRVLIKPETLFLP